MKIRIWRLELLKLILHHWEIRLKPIYSMISQKIGNGFGRKLMHRFGMSQGQIVSILVKIRIQIWIRELFNFLFDSSPLRDSAKNDVVLHSMIFQKCIGPNMFSWIRHYVVEVCALPSALLVFSATVLFCHPTHTKQSSHDFIACYCLVWFILSIVKNIIHFNLPKFKILQ